MFYAENETASVTTAAGEVLAGGASLKWFPGHDNEEGWTESSKVLGLSDKKVTGLEGGYMLRLEFKLKMSGVEQLVVKNCAVADGSTLQEMVIGGDYERISDSATIDKDEETVCSVEKTDYGAEVSFAVRGDVSKIMYYAFYAKTESAESYVILDDVKLYKESRPCWNTARTKIFLRKTSRTPPWRADSSRDRRSACRTARIRGAPRSYRITPSRAKTA